MGWRKALGLSVASGAVVAHGALVAFDPWPGAAELSDGVSLATIALAGLGCILRAVLAAPRRLGWALLGAGLLCWAAGDVYYFSAVTGVADPTYPSLADALYLGYYFLGFAGVLSLARAQRLAHVPSLELLAVLGGLGVIWSLVHFEGPAGSASGGFTQVVTTLAYPLLDFLMVIFVLVVLLQNGRGTVGEWAFLGLALLLTGLADSIWLVQATAGTAAGAERTLLDTLWLVGPLLMVGAAWHPETQRRRRSRAGRSAPILAGASMVVAIVALTIDHWVRLGTLTVTLSIVTLFFGLLHGVLVHRLRLAAEANVRDGALGAAKALAAAVDAKDHYTRNHSLRVAAYAAAIAIRMGWEVDRVETLILAGSLHDVGKIAVPDAILLKPGRLTQPEFELMKTHSQEGERIVRSIDQQDLGRWIRHHHERWDGRGYPDCIGGTRIPIESRILAVADAFDAMTSKRSYQRSLNLEEAVAEVASSGGQFDPDVAKVMVELLDTGALAFEGQVTPAAIYTIGASANGHLEQSEYERLAELLTDDTDATRPSVTVRDAA